MDDIVYTGNNFTLLSHFLIQLSNWFSLKDMGNLNYFLEVDVVPTNTGLSIPNQVYLGDVRNNKNAWAKEVFTPAASSTLRILHDGSKVIDATQHSKLVVKLQYPSLTYLSFAYQSIN